MIYGLSCCCFCLKTLVYTCVVVQIPLHDLVTHEVARDQLLVCPRISMHLLAFRLRDSSISSLNRWTSHLGSSYVYTLYNYIYTYDASIH